MKPKPRVSVAVDPLSSPLSSPRARRARAVTGTALLLVALLALVAGTARSQEPASPTPAGVATTSPEPPSSGAAAPAGATGPTEEASDPREAASAGGGLRVFVDPETGEIVSQPSAEQVRALAAAERRRLESPAVTGEPEPVRLFAVPGGIGADLPASLMSSTVVRVGPDGTLETFCTDHGALERHAHTHEEADPPSETTTSSGGEAVR